MIPYGRQSIDDDDVNAVREVLEGDWLTQGPHVDTFEGAVAARVGARHAIAFSSGTAALHGAAHAAGLGPGDVVVTSPLTFVASASCARYVGARVELIDIDPDTLNLDLAKIPAGVDAIVAVHFAGLPVDLARLRHRPRVVIEDAAQALGATTPDGPVGGCQRSDMCVFSFHPVKSITTAEGGMVTTNDDDLADRLRRFRNHGIRPTPEKGGWAFEVDDIGFNYRLSDLHAALGSHQLTKLDGFLTRRRTLAERYRSELADLPVVLPPPAPAGWEHAHHLFTVQVDQRQRVYDELRRNGVGVQVHHVPVHHHPLHAEAARAPLPHTEAAYARLLSLPLFPDLTFEEQNEVVRTLAAALGHPR